MKSNSNAADKEGGGGEGMDTTTPTHRTKATETNQKFFKH